MLKIYHKYIIFNFLSKFFFVTLIFFSLTVILGVLEEISFSKNLDINFFFPYFLTILNAPITLFEIFPFIFLITTQFLFFDLYKKDELNLLKTNGLDNFSIIKIISILALLIGLINVFFYYNISSNLKFYYSNLKNKLSNDNKYLAMVTKSGLWIKDEVNDNKLIIKSEFIKDNLIVNTVINEFDKNYDLLRIIQSEKIDIKDNLWIIYNPKITTNNTNEIQSEMIYLKTNFNYEKISNLFSNVSTLDIFKLFDLKKDYEKLGYSADDIKMQILKLSTLPLFYTILAILASLVMIRISKEISLVLLIIMGFLISVIIYYFMFFFSSLGLNGNIPITLSIFFPILVLSIICIIGLVGINEI